MGDIKLIVSDTDAFNEEEREFIFEPHGLKYEEFIQCIH